MGSTTFSGPVRAGTIRDNSTANVGKVVLTQTATITQNSTTAVNVIFYLPDNAQIIDFLIDTFVAWNSGTSATLTGGTAAAGTQYFGSVDLKSTAGRLTPTYTGAQLDAMDNIGTNTTVYVTATVVGATSAGNGRITIRYVQN